MTKDEAIAKLIEIENDEIGYLEKASNSDLDDKTANAGDKNYTKYWRDILPSYQGEPWCAAFQTWCFTEAFGKDNASELLKHYPYVYVPTMAELFTLNSNPKVGDIVCFYHSGEFTHTGLVTGVDGDYFTTVEGNTSNGSTIIANGGAVCAKGYYNSNLSGTKFCTLDWNILENYDDGTNTPWQKEYLDKLVSKGAITDETAWSDYTSFVKRGEACAIFDRLSGGTWFSEEADASRYWAEPFIYSLLGKKMISDKDVWLNGADEYISVAQVLALADNATGGTKEEYKTAIVDHWGRNCLNSLCDKCIIKNPHEWDGDFEATVQRGQFMALACKTFNI